MKNKIKDNLRGGGGGRGCPRLQRRYLKTKMLKLPSQIKVLIQCTPDIMATFIVAIRIYWPLFLGQNTPIL